MQRYEPVDSDDAHRDDQDDQDDQGNQSDQGATVRAELAVEIRAALQ